MENIHYGFLRIGSNGEEDDILFLDYEPLADQMQYLHKRIATVRYYISDKEVSLEQAQELFVKSLFGQIEAEYRMCYSEYTGYLWTDEELNVGGHSLLNELRSYVGKYAILVVDTDNEQEKSRVYQIKLNDFRYHLGTLNRIAKDLGEDRNELIKKFDGEIK